MKRIACIRCAAVAWLALLAPAARAGVVEAIFVRDGDAARCVLAITAETALDARPNELVVAMALFDAGAEGSAPISTGSVSISLEGDPPWLAQVGLPTDKIQKQGRYRMMLQARERALGIDYAETITIEKAASTIRTYGYRHNGLFPRHTVHFTLSLNGFHDAALELPVELRLLDVDNNLVLDTLAPVRPAREATWHALDITPRGPEGPCGPFRFDAAIQSDAHAINFRTSHTFAWANAHVPVSGMEDGRPATWFAAHGTPPTLTDGRGFYYSQHLAIWEPATEPRIAYDEAVLQNGTRSLRVDYRPGTESFVWARRALPGKPTYLTVWVKGNNSGDRLRVTFEDNINYSLPGWGRRASFSTETVCVLDFDDWRQFRVPALGAGMQFDSFAGSSDNIDAPIGIKAFRIESDSKDVSNERRAFWIGGIGVETQVRADHRVTLELRADNPDGALDPQDRLTASIGNGWPEPLRKGRLSVTVRDGIGQSIYSVQHDVEVPPNDYATVRVPLEPIAALKPRGPVSVEAVFLDASRPGARASRELTLKAPRHAGVFMDFRDSTVFSGYSPGTILPPASRLVELPLESGNALELPFTPEAYGSALLHPSLPGQVVSVKLRAKARGADAVLQPWFIDGGQTGVGNRPYNLFWAPEFELAADGDWQELVFQAPPIPPGYRDRARSFLFEPYYPLNLALGVTNRTGQASGAVLIDSIELVTHLDDPDAMVVALAHPDDTGMFAPGSSLDLALWNFTAEPRSGVVAFSLRDSQGREVVAGEAKLDVASGRNERVTLIERMEEGVYSFEATAFETMHIKDVLTVVDATAYFGPNPLETLSDPIGLRIRLGLEREPVYLDWDNSEPTPGVFEFGWFLMEAERITQKGRLVPVPVLGFSAEWAGPESAESVARGDYLRSIANLYQTPVRTIDWEVFVREALREFGGRLDEYVFWENPDSPEAPQYIPPERYAELLECVYRWTRLYAPNARVTAGGFNYDKALQYLDRIANVKALPFDRIAVRMNIGELSPEGADMEGFFDELEHIFDLTATGREVHATHFDWGIGPLLSPLDHAAYHARALMILDSRGAPRHDFGLANSGFTFDGHGIFYRRPFGNNQGLQYLKPYYLPKPAFFALRHVADFLASHRFERSVTVPDVCRDWNRVFLYSDDKGRVSAAVWRTRSGRRRYRLPDAWKAVRFRDALGFDVPPGETLDLTPLPYFATMPEGVTLDEAASIFRRLEDVDGAHPVLLDLYTAEPDSMRRAHYEAGGATSVEPAIGRMPGRSGRRTEAVRRGIETERFLFHTESGGDALLTRRWFFEQGGQRLFLRLNDGEEHTWDLTSKREDEPGHRESSLVLRGLRAGENTVAIRYDTPGNSSGYRVEPLPAGATSIDLSRWGMLHAQQTRGDALLHQSAVGTPLRIGDREYASGIGVHAVSLIEFPIDGRVAAMEVTVGVDSSTDGRGTVRFRIFADGREVASSGVVSGLTAPQVLRIENLEEARRLLLSVSDADDGDANDVANWVEGKLFLR